MKHVVRLFSAVMMVALLAQVLAVPAFAESGNTTVTTTVPCTITLCVGENGSVAVDGTEYTGDASFQRELDTVVSYSITPDSGYEINGVLYDGEDVTDSVSGGVYTAPALTDNPTLTVLFASAAHVHEWEDDYTVDKEPTCTEDGSKSIHCKGCNAVRDATPIPATGHSFDAWVTVTSSTCTDSGSEKRVCSVCGYAETRDVNPSGHEWEDGFTVDKEATCTTDGSKSVHCTRCDAVKDSTVIPALGHAWDGGVIVRQATATESGQIKYTCTRCGEVKYATIPATQLPKTGDDNNLGLWAALMCASGAALICLWVMGRKKEEHEN